MPFDWNRAIEINRAALTQVVEEIYAILDFVLGGSAQNLPLVLQRAAYSLLVPAESALRRLILIASRGLKVQLLPPKSMAKGQRILRKGTRALSFQLYDTRKCFAPRRKYTSLTPRISFFDGPDLITISAPKTKKPLTSNRIFRRFEAFKSALENIPREAKRMALWRARRDLKKDVKFRDPLRPGFAPGFRRNLLCEVDRILKECQGLAHDAMREAPS